MVLLDSVPGTQFLKTLDSNRHLAIPVELLDFVPGTDGPLSDQPCGFIGCSPRIIPGHSHLNSDPNSSLVPKLKNY